MNESTMYQSFRGKINEDVQICIAAFLVSAAYCLNAMLPAQVSVFSKVFLTMAKGELWVAKAISQIFSEL